MAIRQIRELGEACLTKICKPVKEMNERTLELIEDMLDTMYEAEGVDRVMLAVYFLILYFNRDKMAKRFAFWIE